MIELRAIFADYYLYYNESYWKLCVVLLNTVIKYYLLIINDRSQWESSY